MFDDAPPSTELAPALALRRLIFGQRITHIIAVAAELGIADHLGATALRAADLAPKLHVQAEELHRLMRALTSIGVLEAHADDRFSLTAMGACLRRDAPDSQHAWARMEHAAFFQRAWGALGKAIETGTSAATHALEMPFYDYMAIHPDVAALFQQSMAEASQLAGAAIAAAYPIAPGARVVDVGGGYGILLTAILRANPTVQGVLFDRPEVVASAKARLQAAGVADRCELIGGNFFHAVPENGDVYILSRVLMDHDDARCVQILRTIARAMPAHGRLLVIQQVLPDGTDATGLFDGIMSDLNMLVMLAGRERTAAEYQHLIHESGLKIAEIIPTRMLMTILEATLYSEKAVGG
ncbi:MAG TPA: methyltransferase [Roseiflexaceae bacterium]|jgi:predicted O-methyltransferase YrrM|nr:methyltransferase [Roseiflexaceae bacterium]